MYSDSYRRSETNGGSKRARLRPSVSAREGNDSFQRSLELLGGEPVWIEPRKYLADIGIVGGDPTVPNRFGMIEI